MAAFRGLALLTLTAAVTACGSVRGTSVYQLDGKTVLYAVDNGEAAFVVFTDMLEGRIEDGAPADRDQPFSGTLTGERGARVAFSSDGASATINGRTFDLDEGRVFVLQTAGVSRIAQLPIGRDELEHSNENMLDVIRALAESHDRIRWFVWPPEIV